MHILHIYKDYYPVLGGIENHIKVLAEAHVAMGHQVTALVCNPGKITQIDTLNGVQIIKSGRLTTLASMPLSIRQPLSLMQLRPDIAHLHSPYPLGEAAQWLLGRAKATVITYHSDVVRQKNLLRIYGPILQRVLRSVDRVLPTSPRYIESSPWLRPVRDKCTVVPLAVDTTRFTPSLTQRQDPLALLFVGRLRYYKGLDVLLRALPNIPDAHLTVVGDGPMEEIWQALAVELNISDRVTFTSEVSDDALPGYYHQADVFVLPANARSEAFGTVLLEAMASGLPCITTELGTGTSWVVQDSVTGYVIPPNDSQALAQAVNKLATDEAWRQKLGQASFNRATTTFTEPIMVENVIRVYNDLLAR
ncbi:MAG: glycosyltransferase [Chloroflexota bacterium]